jgi:cell division protein FtsB
MTDTPINTRTEEPAKKGAPLFLVFITIVLTLALAYLVYSYFGQKKKMVEMEMVLTQEKDSLANELRLMVHGYDTLKSNNDTLNAKLKKERSRIVQLLNINASNVQLIRQYKGEISTMRNIMKSYIVQIDSLNTRNKILVAENQDIKEQITTVKQSNVTLSKVKEELSTKVEIASQIQAKDIVVQALNKTQKETSLLPKQEKKLFT